MKTSHRRKYSIARDVYEWWLWRRAQRAIGTAFPGSTVVSDRRTR